MDVCQFQYEDCTYLNICQSIGVVIGILVSPRFRNIETRIQVLMSLGFLLLETSLYLLNFKRINLDWGISDFTINMITMMIGKAAVLSLSVLPMTTLMMKVTPSNIEASMFALIGSILSLTTDWLGDFVGGVICNMYGITETDYSNYQQAIVLKMFLVSISMAMVFILPTDNEVAVL